MRLLLVTPEFPPHTGGGILKYYALMTAAWKAAGVDVSVLVASPFDEVAAHMVDGVPVAGIPIAKIDAHANRLTHLSAAPLFRRYLASGLAAADWLSERVDRFDVIETTDFGLLFAAFLLLKERPPIVVRLHGSLGQIARNEPVAPASELDFALASLTEAILLPAADSLVALSPANARDWREHLGRDVDFVPPPFPPATPAKGLCDTGGYAAVVAARIQSWKGPEVLCQALALSKGPARDHQIAWLGRDTASGPEGQSMSAWLGRQYPDIWGTRIVPLGQRPLAEVAAMQSAAHVVVVPSRWDTFNYALAEAMALGCTTIASTGVGASYLIEDGINGFTFPADDAAALADRLGRAHTMDESERRAMGREAQATIRHELDPTTITEQTISAFRSVATGHSRPVAVSPWIREFFLPDSTRRAAHGYLENVSIRELAGHLTERLSRKVLGGS